MHRHSPLFRILNSLLLLMLLLSLNGCGGSESSANNAALKSAGQNTLTQSTIQLPTQVQVVSSNDK